MLTSEGHREDLDNDIKFEESKEKRFDKTFFEKIDWLTKKLHEVNGDRFNVKVEVVEKKIEPKKTYSNRYKNFNRGMADRKTI